MVLLEILKNRYVYNIHIDCRPHEPKLPQLRPGVDVEPGEHAGGHQRGGGGVHPPRHGGGAALLGAGARDSAAGAAPAAAPALGAQRAPQPVRHRDPRVGTLLQ